MAAIETPITKDEFSAMVDAIEAGAEYDQPAAFALGLATVEEQEDGPGRILDVQLTRRNYAGNYGTAAVLAAALDQEETGLRTGNYLLTPEQVQECGRLFTPFNGEPGHGNIHTLDWMGTVHSLDGSVLPEADTTGLANPRYPVLSVVRSWEDAPETVGDVYLRLYALSDRHRVPNTINLDGAFPVLPNVVVSEQVGTFSPEKWNDIAEVLVFQGVSTAVRVLDKFPRMLDHVVPSGVRIADPSRVRLGAFLGEGTTLMHEGFANFNAGTLGESMVEGRISAGVVVGEGTDIGGGVSIMGTLSGGGKEKITVGEGCLLEANSGLGISLGDDCRVEAGLYVKSTTPVSLPDGRVVKAAELSGDNNMMFRRNAQTGAVELVPNKGTEWGGLNTELHAGN